MCNVVHFSTTSEEDLTLLPHDHFIVQHPDEDDAPHLALLQHPNKWYLAGRFGGCSCHFRHLGVFELDPETGRAMGTDDAEFLTPEQDPSDRSDEQEREDTKVLYDLIARLVAEGHQIDLLDSWNGEDLPHIKHLEVSFSQVPRDAFRLFEGYRFDFTP